MGDEAKSCYEEMREWQRTLRQGDLIPPNFEKIQIGAILDLHGRLTKIERRLAELEDDSWRDKPPLL
jgi:hypothetical protein